MRGEYVNKTKIADILQYIIVDLEIELDIIIVLIIFHNCYGMEGVVYEIEY